MRLNCNVKRKIQFHSFAISLKNKLKIWSEDDCSDVNDVIAAICSLKHLMKYYSFSNYSIELNESITNRAHFFSKPAILFFLGLALIALLDSFNEILVFFTPFFQSSITEGQLFRSNTFQLWVFSFWLPLPHFIKKI